MPKPTIDQIRGIGDLATSYHWNLNFLTPPKIGTYPESALLNLRCMSTDVPTATVAPIAFKIRGHQVNQPGQIAYNGSITLKFVETVDNVVANFFRQWREACYQSKTGAQGAKSQVESIIQLERLNRQDEGIWGYKLVGCIYQNGTTTPLGSDASNLEMDLTIAYDYFEDVQV